MFAFQVGNDPNSGQSGVGIGSFGDIKVSGVVTATTFSGNLSGDVIGNVTGTVTGNINSGLATITQINATNINVSGLSTDTLRRLDGQHRIGFSTSRYLLNVGLGTTGVTGIVTSIDITGDLSARNINANAVSYTHLTLPTTLSV